MKRREREFSDCYAYNLADPGLIVGAQALDDALESGFSPEDIIPLQKALTDEVTPVTKPEKLDVDDWSRQDYIAFGKWLMNVANEPLTHRRALLPAYNLGFGPEPQRIYRKDIATKEKRFDGYADFYDQIGAKDAMRKGRFDHWDFLTLMKYVKKEADNAAAEGIRPTVAFFNKLAAKGKGPSSHSVQRIADTPFGKLIDMAGYPEPRSWSTDDFIDWGVRFTIANDGRLPYMAGIEELSKRFRGPSEASLRRRFGGIMSFQTVVTEAYEKHVKEAESLRQVKLDAIQLEIEAGTMPIEMIEIEDHDKMLLQAGKYWIARKLIPHLSQEQLFKIATESLTTKAFVGRLTSRDPRVKQAHVEATATALGVVDDLWPMDGYKEYMRVGQAENDQELTND